MPEPSPPRREILGERLYQRYCTGCHGTTGEGDGLHSYTLNPPPANHTDGVYMKNLSDEYLFEVISNGGASVRKSTEMPRWKDILNKNEIGNLIRYVRTLPKKRLAQEIEEKSP
jgi:mono/diheme cytochrome c family protein